ncbi:MAG: hypothetical protein R3264_10830 [Anaerolineae bacterium]|nr:hypothetical protein [Anaerolineae bacterium]
MKYSTQEARLAENLTHQLDALLIEGAMPSSPVDEIAELLPIAEKLAAMAPIPDPAFGPALKETLFRSPAVEDVTISSPWVGPAKVKLLILIIVALIAVAILTVLVGNSIGKPNFSPGSELDPTALPPPTQIIRTDDGGIIVPSVTVSPQPASTDGVGDSISAPEPTSTPIVDVLPPITVTEETTVTLPVIPELVPGNAGSDTNDGNGGSAGNGGDKGDHDRGHGNDADGHDEDNPGKGGNN